MINTISDSVYHFFLVGVLLHFFIFCGVAHISHFNEGGRSLTPVIAGHGVCLSDVFPAAACGFYISVQHSGGQRLILAIHRGYIGISAGRADGHGTAGIGVVNAIGMDADKSICPGFVGNLSTLDAAEWIFTVGAGHYDLAASFLKQGAKLQADIQSEFVFWNSGGNALCSGGVFGFHLA